MTSSSIDVPSSTKLYKFVLSHIAKNNDNGRLEASIAAAKGKKKQSRNCCGAGECSLTDASSSSTDRIALEAGLGDFTFVDFHNNVMTATHKMIGDPVGTQCDAVLYKTLTVSCIQGKEKLLAFFQTLVENSEKSTEGYISIYHWHNKYRYWNQTLRIKARSLDSVILPTETVTTILQDMDSFIAQDTQDFYEKHGIPYRRSYLFYGVPGAGKTSCIQAIAGAYKRSVAYLNIDPDMTDDGLRSAMDDLPEETIVVLEDIDSLFTKDRQAKQAKSTLTFTGLLNALDGVGSSLGQLFILTTNLREQLDSALIRNGRVDMQVFFDYANDEQIMKMWNVFYPNGIHLSDEFCRILRTKLEGKMIAPCALQHFFVSQRTNSAEVALLNVDSLIEDMKQKEVEDIKTKDAAAAAAASEKGNKEKDGDDDDDEKKTTKGSESDLLNNIHIHFHGVDGTTTTSATGATAMVSSSAVDSPIITTTTPPGVNNRSFTVTITTSSSSSSGSDNVPTTPKTKKDEENSTEEVVVAAVTTQAIDETKTA